MGLNISWVLFASYNLVHGFLLIPQGPAQMSLYLWSFAWGRVIENYRLLSPNYHDIILGRTLVTALSSPFGPQKTGTEQALINAC